MQEICCCRRIIQERINQLVKEITGHESANTIFHYSGNIQNLIKCRAYSLYEMSKRREIIVESKVDNNNCLVILGGKIANSVEVDQGKCFSLLFTQGNMEDCYAVSGNCDICKYFNRDKRFKDIIKKQETEVEKRIERLKKWIYSEKQYRNTDEFKILTNQLQTYAENLKNMLIEEMKDRDIYE